MPSIESSSVELSVAPSILSRANRLTGAFFGGLFSFWTGRGLRTGMGAAHSSRSHSILQPLYLLRDLYHVKITKCIVESSYIMHVRANMALWTELVDTWALPSMNLILTTNRLWMWSKSSRIDSSVCLGLADLMRIFLVAPIPILWATWFARVKCRSDHEIMT
jgi:hypothetical protein